MLASEHGVTHLLVEGGPKIHASFFAANLADRVWVVRSPMRVDSSDAPSAVNVTKGFAATLTVPLGSDNLTEYLNRASAVFFASDSSADLLLTKRDLDATKTPGI
jgi:riboflavin biosynthesis pyrimidine reductase